MSPGENVVRDDVFHERSLVVLLFIIVLCEIQRDLRHPADGVRCGVVPVHQDGKAIGGVPALQREEGLSCICNRCFRRCGDRRNGLGLAVADPGRVARGDDVALNVHNTDNILRCLRELFCNVLKNPT